MDNASALLRFLRFVRGCCVRKLRGMQVRVVRCKQDGQIYALKMMQKWDLMKRLEVRPGCLSPLILPRTFVAP